MDVPLGTVERPLWRGRLHGYALFAAVPLAIALELSASGAKARVAVTIYVVALCSMFAVSATYHRWVHTLRARDLWRRADHATIFLMIAGSMTPVALLALPERLGLVLMVIMWTGSVVGMGMKIVKWRHARVVGGVMYIAVSWVGVVAIPVLWQRVGVLSAVLVIISGVVYTGGAIGLNRRWPRLRPTVFSYHEVWHACTVLAAGAHLGAIWIILH